MIQRYKQCLLALTLLLLSAGVVFAGDNSDKEASRDIDQFRSKIPAMLANNGNVGTEFYLSFPPCYEQGGQNNNLKLYVSSGVATDVTVEVKRHNFIITKTTIPNDIIEFNIAPGIGQPFVKPAEVEAPPDAVYQGGGVHITSDAPIIVYGVTRFQYTSDGFLAIPVSGLGKEYIVSSYGDMSAMYPGIYLPSETTITAAFDNTQVFFTMGGNIISRTASGTTPGQTKRYSLNAGDVLSINTRGHESDLSGSIVRATRPVAIVSGNQCANVPTGLRWCDFIIESELPVHTWGTAYHVTRIIKRKGNGWIKIYAKEPNTTVYRDGQVIGLIQKGGGIEGEGYIHRQVADGDPKSFVISADKPIYVVQYNPGQEFDNITADPWQLVLTPLEQFQTEITFNTPGIRGGFGFAENYVNLVYELDENGTVPADLEFAKVTNGQFEWRPVKDLFGTVPGDRFDVDVVEGRSYAMKTLQLPGDGVYKIRATRPFAAYAYGADNYDTYAFPTSVALGDISVDDPDHPVPSFTQDCQGKVDGTVIDMPNDDKRRSNLASVRMVQDPTMSFNYIFEVDKFEPGATRSTEWTLRVADQTMPAQATLVFIDRAGNSFDTVIKYTPFMVVADQDEIDFGIVKGGNMATRELLLTNTSKTDAMVIEKLQLAGGAQGFTITVPSPLNLPITLEPNDGVNTNFSIKLTIVFDANLIENKEGSYADKIDFGGECSEIPVDLKARVGDPIIHVQDAIFGTKLVGEKDRRNVVLRNKSADIPLTISSVTGPTNPAFTVEYPAGFDPNTAPYVLAPKAQIQFTVTFEPAADIDYSDQIVFASDAPNNYEKHICLLTGDAVTGGLIAEGFDFDRVRINAPAPVPGTITIRNPGEAEVTVKSVRVSSDAGGVQDRFDFAAVASWVSSRAPIRVAPKGSLEIPVSFDPQVIGEHEVGIEFVYDAPGSADQVTNEAILLGVGTQGVLNVEDYNFGSLLLGTSSNETIEVEIINGPYNEAVTITGFMDMGGNSIAGEFTDPNGGAVTLPATLDVGERLTFTATFEPAFVGNRNITWETISDADVEDQTVWNGEGYTTGIPTGRQLPFEPICAGTSGIVEVLIENEQDIDFDITGFVLDVLPDANFTVESISYNGTDYQPGDQWVLGAQSQATVRILYTPSVAGTNDNVLVMTYDSDARLEVPFGAEATYYEAESGLQADLGGRTEVIPGDAFTVEVGLKAGQIESRSGAERLIITLKYNPRIITAFDDQVDAVDAINYRILDVERVLDSRTEERLIITVGLNNNQVNQGGIAKVVFGAMLADYTKVNGQKATIEADIEVVGSPCANIIPSDGDAALGVVCAIELRNVTFSGVSYGISQNTPNPASVNTTIEYAIGIEAHTTLELYNAMGELVLTSVDERKSAGRYEVTIETADLPTGVYFYKLVSGPYTETRRMVITR